MATPFQAALDKVSEAVTDLSELEVLTFRGEIKSVINSAGRIEWNTLLGKAAPAGGNAPVTTGTLKLVLATNVKIDSDVQMFVADEKPEPWLIEAHNAAVKAGLESRRALLELGFGLLRK